MSISLLYYMLCFVELDYQLIFRCGIKASISGFSYISLIYSGLFNWINIILSVFTYINIFLKIIRSSIRVRMMNKEKIINQIITPENKMVAIKFVIFVFALLIQWLPMSTYLFASAVGGQTTDVLSIFAVIFANLGGLFNGAIYMLFRRRYRQKGEFSSQGKSTKIQR